MVQEIHGVKGRSAKEVRRFTTHSGRDGVEFGIASDVLARNEKGEVLRDENGKAVIKDTEWTNVVAYGSPAERVARMIEQNGSLPIVAIGRWVEEEYEKTVDGNPVTAISRKFQASDLAINAVKPMTFPEPRRNITTARRSFDQDMEVEQHQITTTTETSTIGWQ